MKTKVKFISILLLLALLRIGSNVYSQSNTQNDSSIRPMQISFLPFLSYNCNFPVLLSLNIIGGSVEEVRGLEMGSVINIDRNNAGKCQLAGICNLVGGSSTGVQMAGVFNCAISQNGFQASGLANVIKKSAGKCQLAGVSNMTGGSFDGLQAAGVFNMAECLKGMQASGVINVIKTNAGQCQMAGVANLVGGASEGFQAAGVFNLSKSIKGIQIAGVLNNAEFVSGMQISGLINRASFFKGVQLGVFNFSDSCQGIPIGVMSFVRKNGYYKLELSADEIFYTNLAFRSGMPKFYTSITAGIRPDNFTAPLWSYGFGIGTKFGKQSNFSYDLELSSQHVSKEFFSDYVSDLHKLYVGIDRKISSQTSVAVGLTYNFFITDTDDRHYNEKLSGIMPYKLTNNTYSRNGINIKTWIGGKIAIRFL
jgi:hypothetical protein